MRAPDPHKHVGLLALLLTVLTLGAEPIHSLVSGEVGDDAPMLIQSERSRTLLDAGREAIFQFKLAEAESTFTMLAALPDGKVAAAFHLETISLLKLIASDKAVYFDEFLVRSDALRDMLEEEPASTWQAFLKAEADLHRAIARSKRGQYLRAALAGRSAYLGYERLLQAHPDFYDAYKGMGVLHAGIGSASGARRKFLGLLGFDGTVEEGMRELRLAAEKSHFNREEAQVFLAQIDMRLFGSSEQSGEMMGALWQRYPESPLLAHLYGSYLYETRQAKAAEHVYRQAAGRADQRAYFYVDYIDFYLADVLFRQDQFEESAFYYRRYLERHEGPALKATALLHLGLALEMQGEREEAIIYYQQVQSLRSFDSDAVAQRTAQRLQAHPLNGLTRTLLLSQNAYDSGRYARAHTLLRTILEDAGTSHDEKAEAAYRQGRVFHAEGHLDKALAAYASAVAWHDDPTARWGPWAQYFTGIILEQRSDMEGAEEALAAALAYTGEYGYHQVLERDAKIALRRVKQARP